MTEAALIGTAFEYSQISTLGARITNDIDGIMLLMGMYHMPVEDIAIMAKARHIASNLHYGYTSSSLLKKLEEKQPL